MTGGVDEDYTSPGSFQVPTKGPDDERAAEAESSGASTIGEVSADQAEQEIVPHTRPFRAWGAAHGRDRTPSLWERFVGWLRGLFSRKNIERQSLEKPVLEEIEIRDRDEYAILLPLRSDNEERIEEPVIPAPATTVRPVVSEPEPLWDTPVVAQPTGESPPNLEASEFSDVWTQRKSPLDGVDWKIFEEQPKQGFFARLFSRKKKPEPMMPGNRSEDPRSHEPAEADFAADPMASMAPALDDFSEEPARNSPSLDHSAADSANLAAFLDATAPVDDSVDPSLTVDPVTPLPVGPKKAGFFSGLLNRVSRSQFVPKEALEPEAVTPAMEAPAIVPVDEPHIVEPPAPAPDELAAKYGPPAVEERADDFEATVPVPIPAVPPPVFRDARDDFAEEDARRDSAAMAKVDVPPMDDGEKTDEFEIVPMPISGDATAETRIVPGFFGRMFTKKAEEDASKAEAHTRAMPDDKVPFVLAKFRSFYNEVIRDKHQKSDVIAGFATAVMGAGGAGSESDPEFAAQLLSKRLGEMLELQAAESNWTGGDAAKYYPEAQYAMVALADETFATIDWPGRASWHKHMLEPKMYGTRGADIEFFKRIDKLLKEAPDEKGARDLARLYLMVIASGYRGKFRVPNVRRPLAEYRRRLYEYSHQNDPLELYARDRKVFPQAVAHTLVSRSVGRFTPAQKWIAAVLVLAVLYIGISHYAWTSVSADVRDVMSRIQSSISSPGSR